MANMKRDDATRCWEGCGSPDVYAAGGKTKIITNLLGSGHFLKEVSTYHLTYLFKS